MSVIGSGLRQKKWDCAVLLPKAENAALHVNRKGRAWLVRWLFQYFEKVELHSARSRRLWLGNAIVQAFPAGDTAIPTPAELCILIHLPPVCIW
jgi:hypothetical protein